MITDSKQPGPPSPPIYYVTHPKQVQRQPPTSHYDSLVAFHLLRTLLPAAPTTNESLWLVGGFSLPPCLSTPASDHQQVIATRWWLFIVSHSLHLLPPTQWVTIGFHHLRPLLPATPTTNKSLWLVGGFLLLLLLLLLYYYSFFYLLSEPSCILWNCFILSRTK